MSHSLAAPDAFQDLVLFALSIGWNKHNHHLAHDFFGGVSEEALRTLIPGNDGSPKVDAYDASSEDSTMAARRCAWLWRSARNFSWRRAAMPPSSLVRSGG